jgi:hypothetical protein
MCVRWKSSVAASRRLLLIFQRRHSASLLSLVRTANSDSTS